MFGTKYRNYWIFSLLLCVVAVATTNHWLLNPNFHPRLIHMRGCHGRGCGYVLLVYLAIMGFVALPVWLKFPIAIFLGIGWFSAAILNIIRSVDGNPDLAIGPEGVCLPRHWSYLRVKWKDVKRIESVGQTTKHGSVQDISITLYGFGPTERTLRSVGPLVDPALLTIKQYFGFSHANVLAAIAANAPHITIKETVAPKIAHS